MLNPVKKIHQRTQLKVFYTQYGGWRLSEYKKDDFSFQAFIRKFLFFKLQSKEKEMLSIDIFSLFSWLCEYILFKSLVEIKNLNRK